MLKARGVDLRILGVFSEGLRPTLTALYDIDDNNLDLLQESHSAECAQTYQTHMVAARLRSAAARIWLLTLHARLGEDIGIAPDLVTILNLGVGNLWMMLWSALKICKKLQRSSPAAISKVFAADRSSSRIGPTDRKCWTHLVPPN